MLAFLIICPSKIWLLNVSSWKELGGVRLLEIQATLVVLTRVQVSELRRYRWEEQKLKAILS